MKRLREQKGYSIRTTARLAGYSPGHLCLIEQGKRLPNRFSLTCLLQALSATDQAARLGALLIEEQIERLC
ncbi:helix-turn-helix domain-containing protein [Oligoflexus tunisiensis]|uniref:helix-turn-helix domain-containing protein n=1 Tax=Oligoflexus tunisiensis TaxID=708132 RepID=UPI00159F0AD4|nr:helix-turn-helix transcriptional regulator [Oligoflexus tunisiensis]